MNFIMYAIETPIDVDGRGGPRPAPSLHRRLRLRDFSDEHPSREMTVGDDYADRWNECLRRSGR